MIESFISFVEGIFPCIDPYVAERTRSAVRQFTEGGCSPVFLLPKPLSHLCQGDIINDIPFFIYDSDGTERMVHTKGMLISNTCDAEHDGAVILAPMFRIDALEGLDKRALKQNQIFRFLHLPDSRIGDYVVDLGMLAAYPTGLVARIIETSGKCASLTQLGYYFFLCKLTVHLMRPEDQGVQMTRAG